MLIHRKTEYLNDNKLYVPVTCRMSACGKITPLSFNYKGREIGIDKIYDVKKEASMTAGGCGISYKCGAEGTLFKIFLEDGRWFMEILEN